jgi:hypothetical protein
VIVQDYRVYGDGVNIAARLQSIAAPGSICVSEAVYQQVYKKLDLAFEDLGLRELKNIEHPVRLYRVALPGTRRADSAPHAPEHDRPVVSPRPASNTWSDALLHPSSLVPFLVGAYLIATLLGLPPTGHLFPAFGAVLVAVGFGRALRLRTGRHAFFLIVLGPGLVLAAFAGTWHRGTPWWLVVGGIAVTAAGLAQLRTPARRRPH